MKATFAVKHGIIVVMLSFIILWDIEKLFSVLLIPFKNDGKPTCTSRRSLYGINAELCSHGLVKTLFSLWLTKKQRTKKLLQVCFCYKPTKAGNYGILMIIFCNTVCLCTNQ